MNKENQFIENQISTAIHDSCSNTTYSSKFLRTQKKQVLNKNILPSKYQRSAIYIQRFWRLKQCMRRKINQKIIQDLQSQNQCYKLQNKILEQLVQKYKDIIMMKKSFQNMKIKQYCNDSQSEILLIKKQCVIVSFKLQKSIPTKQMVEQIIGKKEQERQLNLMLNRQILIIQEDLQEEKRENEMLMKQLRKVNELQLEVVKQKNELSQRMKERMLETSKFGSRGNDYKSTKENSRQHEQDYRNFLNSIGENY